MSLVRAKQANDVFKRTVFGFVREHEKKESINAPEIVKYFVLNYYLLTDKFTNNGKCIDLEEGETVAKLNDVVGNIYSADYAVLGSTEVGHLDEKIRECHWSLQMNAKGRRGMIGIVSQQEKKETQFDMALGLPLGSLAYLIFERTDSPFLTEVTGGVCAEGNVLQNYSLGYFHISKKDLIHAVLDLKAQKLSWYINDKHIWNVGKDYDFNIAICRLWIDLNAFDAAEIKIKDFSIKQKSE